MIRTSGLSCGVVLILLTINLLLGAFATDYLISFWFAFFHHAVPAIPFIVCALIGLIGGEVIIPAAVITWLLSFFI